MLFRKEVLIRQRKCRAKKSTLEELSLTSNDFSSLKFLEEALSPFADAQRCLEGDQYVTISLLVITVKRLHDAIPSLLHAALEPDLQDLIQSLLNDFYDRWGHNVYYSSTIHRICRDRQQGIPVYAYWAALLDPRTKWMTVRLLLEDEKRLIWGDIRKEIVQLVEASHAEPLPVGNDEVEVREVPPRKKRKGAASFLAPSSEQAAFTDASDGGVVSVEAEVTLELSYYEKEKGCDLYDVDGNFLCPLSWWKSNCTRFPSVWQLAQKILSIPATSAPSERVFSVASGIMNKKRASIKSTNAELLMFLRGNKSFIEWS